MQDDISTFCMNCNVQYNIDKKKKKVEKCPALQVAIDVFFGAGTTGKVDSYKRKEACTQG